MSNATHIQKEVCRRASHEISVVVEAHTSITRNTKSQSTGIFVFADEADIGTCTHADKYTHGDIATHIQTHTRSTHEMNTDTHTHTDKQTDRHAHSLNANPKLKRSTAKFCTRRRSDSDVSTTGSAGGTISDIAYCESRRGSGGLPASPCSMSIESDESGHSQPLETNSLLQPSLKLHQFAAEHILPAYNESIRKCKVPDLYRRRKHTHIHCQSIRSPPLAPVANNAYYVWVLNSDLKLQKRLSHIY